MSGLFDVPGERFTDADGVEFITLVTATNIKFVTACLAEWGNRTGQDRRWMSEHKAVNVPVSVVEVVRQRLAAKGEASAGSAGRRAGEKAGSAPE